MLKARRLTEAGTFESVTADELEKAAFQKLAAEGHLLCEHCPAPVKHVASTRIDGGHERVGHFRSDDIEAHDLHCINRNDPRSSKMALALRDALASDQQILVNINIDPKILGFDGLRDRFNAVVSDPDKGLFTKDNWVKTKAQKGYLAVPAHDITDILYYLEFAKEYGGNDALKQLWFNTSHAVQSCGRFVVANNPMRTGIMLTQMVERAIHGRNSQGVVIDTPRLFSFEATNAQIQKALEEERHQLYGQQMDVGFPLNHIAKLGLLFEKSGDTALSNQSVLHEGRRFWVVARPQLDRARAHQIVAKANGRNARHVPPAFVFLSVKDRVQFVSPDAPKKPTVDYRARRRQRNAPSDPHAV